MVMMMALFLQQRNTVQVSIIALAYIFVIILHT